MEEEFQSWANKFTEIHKKIKDAQETFRDYTYVSTTLCGDLEEKLRDLRRVSETCLQWVKKTESKWMSWQYGGPNAFEVSHSLRCFDSKDIARLILEVNSFMMLGIGASDQKKINAHVNLESELKKTAEKLQDFIQELEKGCPKDRAENILLLPLPSTRIRTLLANSNTGRTGALLMIYNLFLRFILDHWTRR